MKYAVIYTSKTGNTKALAEMIPTVLGKEPCIYLGEPKQKIDADLFFLGSWTDKGCFHDAIINFMKSQEHKKVILFGTAGFGQSEEYFQGIIQRTIEKLPDSTKVLGSFMCQGRMPYAVKARYEAMQEKDPQNSMYLQMIENYDQALDHPDDHDLENFTAFLKEGKRKWL